ncbi:MAG: twin-arginine translocase subunit TatC [Victivallaceae bacterium]|nr:twin-arginine translocase subunit TatC [Victivallaceae bacterium]
MTAPGGENSFIAHLESLRKTLLRILAATAVMYPVGYLISPYVIAALVKWSLPETMGKLHYFAPMEVFWVQLKLAFILALAMAYPWNVFQIWRFMLPALYRDERRALGWWIMSSSVLFFGGVAFCSGFILPLLMRFSGGFATPELQPIIGLANFLNLAGWLMLAFGVMFQSPLVVLLAVRFGVISAGALRRKRPYIMTAILIVAAVLTPPDVVSQILLAVPTWLLFELGLFFATRLEKQRREHL